MGEFRKMTRITTPRNPGFTLAYLLNIISQLKNMVNVLNDHTMYYMFDVDSLISSESMYKECVSLSRLLTEDIKAIEKYITSINKNRFL